MELNSQKVRKLAPENDPLKIGMGWTVEDLDLSLIHIQMCIRDRDYDSIGGLVIGFLDHLPEEGESVKHEGLRFVVEKMDKNRIEKIHIYRLEQPQEEEKSE